jgi:small subunit ribosomal protein S5
MSDEKKVIAENKKSASDQKTGIKDNKQFGNNNSPFGFKKKPFPGKKRFGDRPKEEFDQRILDIARVTRVMKGGKRMSFRACVVIGDKKGRVAVALGKGSDVSLAVNKAVNKAKKNIVKVPLTNDKTIPHEVFHKFGASKIFIKPASKGRGVIAGGVVRVIMDLAGVKNVTAKILGTNNKVNNAKCTVLALDSLKAKIVGDDKNDNVKKEDKKTVSASKKDNK